MRCHPGRRRRRSGPSSRVVRAQPLRSTIGHCNGTLRSVVRESRPAIFNPHDNAVHARRATQNKMAYGGVLGRHLTPRGSTKRATNDNKTCRMCALRMLSALFCERTQEEIESSESRFGSKSDQLVGPTKPEPPKYANVRTRLAGLYSSRATPSEPRLLHLADVAEDLRWWPALAAAVLPSYGSAQPLAPGAACRIVWRFEQGTHQGRICKSRAVPLTPCFSGPAFPGFYLTSVARNFLKINDLYQ